MNVMLIDAKPASVLFERNFCFEITTPQYNITCQAESQEYADDWIYCINTSKADISNKARQNIVKEIGYTPDEKAIPIETEKSHLEVKIKLEPSDNVYAGML